MSRLLKRRKGVTLITVVIVAAVLSILALLLMDAALYGIVLTKKYGHDDMAYYAAESAIEKWFGKILQLSNDSTFAADIVYTDKDALASGIIGKLEATMAKVQDIDIAAGTSLNIANVERVNLTAEDSSMSDNSIKIKIGLTVKSTFLDGTNNFTAYDKTVYALKEFTFSVPSSYKLETAINTLGDLYVNNIEVDIKGDVMAFGSFPNLAMTNEQYFYGGIYARNNSTLNIKGNAYSRSFIRTGPYLKDNFSRINVYKDAVAQGIQAIGNGDKMGIYRNAYTFDDVEVNGQQSIIAINGSFIGLSRSGPWNSHDGTSAVVNSAFVHNSVYNDEEAIKQAKRSRILVNGDLIIPGGTFRVDNSGIKTGQIEDASVAWIVEDGFGIPYYKTYEWKEADLDSEDYHKSLRTQWKNPNAKMESFFNLFQVFDLGYANYNDLDNVGGFNSTYSDFVDTIMGSVSQPVGNTISAISGAAYPEVLHGFWPYEVAANNRLYQNEIKDGEGYLSIGYGTPTKIIDSSYSIDNIFDAANNLLYDSDTWNTDEFENADPEYVHTKLAAIKTSMQNHVEIFAKRDYKQSTELSWETEDTGLFGETLKNLKETAKTHISLGNEYCILIEDSLSIAEMDMDIVDLVPGIYEKREEDYSDDTEYYLIINEDCEITLKVSGEFNGIIFSAGKVVLDEGADIRGAIVSGTGKGSFVSGKFVPELNKLSVSDSNVVNSLDDGDYAGVKISGTGGGKVKVDFYLGLSQAELVLQAAGFGPTDLHLLNRAARINLLKKFEEKGIYLQNIL